MNSSICFARASSTGAAGGSVGVSLFDMAIELVVCSAKCLSDLCVQRSHKRRLTAGALQVWLR